jgi:hypothetical protein
MDNYLLLCVYITCPFVDKETNDYDDAYKDHIRGLLIRL